ncbi:MAG: ribonuclease J [Eubacteriales bacterium]|nr:ribonuclease J [Eubacteriales bacterium]
MANRQPPKLRVIPLGGVDEIGRNITVLEYGNDMIVVDCGVSFPTEEMPGIDLVIPDTTYIEKNKQKLRAVLITHGHEDHIGALPYLLRNVNVPVYGTKLTLMLAEHKLEEAGVKKYKLVEITPREKRQCGCFSVEFIKTNHSITGSVALAITTPVGVVIMTGDFKVDLTPVDGDVMDFATLARYGEEGVLLLMADSTNVERPGYTVSEQVVGKNIDDLFRNIKGRIIISTFSSNVHRVQQIVDSAVRYSRKVAFAGRSMVMIAQMAQDIGALKVKPENLVPIDKIGKLKDNKIVIITTGSQGEPMSGLVRMAGGEHSHVEIKQGDTVIFSSRPIPGNEKFINRVINQLYRNGAEVVYDSVADVHASGHACREELKLMHRLVKPKYFMPLHGEYRHLIKHAELAESLGMKRANIFIPEVGRPLEITKKQAAAMGDIVPSGAVMVDGSGVGDVGNIVLRDRVQLSQDGMVIVVMPLAKNSSRLMGAPEVISRGFVYEKESDELLEAAKKTVRELFEKYNGKNVDWSVIKSDVRRDIRKVLYNRTRRSPMILPIIVEI